MPIPDNTINAQYEYRIANIVKMMVHNKDNSFIPTTGDELEQFLEGNKEALLNYLLDDIQEYIGFDELLKQVKGE